CGTRPGAVGRRRPCSTSRSSRPTRMPAGPESGCPQRRSGRRRRRRSARSSSTFAARSGSGRRPRSTDIPASARSRTPSTRRRSSATATGCFVEDRGSPIQSLRGRRSATGIFRSGGRSSPAFAVLAMPSASTETLRVDVPPDEVDGRSALYAATRRGLDARVKELPTVWLYDARGSRLYEEITRLPEYYLARREAEILRAQAREIA